MPDYFIPLDTMRYTKYYRDLSAKGAIINASLKYIDKNRKKLKKKYPSFDDYKRDFEIPQSLIKAVFSEGEKGKVKAKDDKDMQAADEAMGNAIIGLFKVVFGNKQTDQILQIYDNRALEMLGDIAPFIAEVIAPRVQEAQQRIQERYKQVSRRGGK